MGSNEGMGTIGGVNRSLLLLAFVAGCPNGGSGGSGRDTETGTGITITDTDDATINPSETADTGSGTMGDSTGGACPEPRECAEDCCEEGEVCNDGVCELDCGVNDACLDVCCEGGEICYVAQCIVPGGPCNAAACATEAESDCAEDEICDPELGLCVPNLANGTCAFEPDPGVFDPIPRFTWGIRQDRDCGLGCQKEEACNAVSNLCEPTWVHVSIAADDFPNHHQVVASPVVADLDGDCVPEIVFGTYQNQAYTSNGILRAIRGDNGAKVWTVGDPNFEIDPSSTPAIGDLDGDGSPEVIAKGEGNNLIAVSASGTPIWTSEGIGSQGNSGSPSIANFDNAGDAEIAYGKVVVDSLGSVLYNPTGPSGSSGGFGPLSCVADLDGDGRPELIAGATVHQFTGTVGVDFVGSERFAGTPADGYCGIADFGNDGTPEIVTVVNNDINVFNGQTGALLASIAISGSGAGGAPNIADFDGDGVPDIGTAGGTRYVVVQFDGVDTMTQLWESVTVDGSSNRTGSSVFDFDGDGSSEVIYGDEQFLRIYPGVEPGCPAQPSCDGTMDATEVLFSDINSSRTRTEYPLVVDVDGDFKAEIVLSTNNESSQGSTGDAGIEVFEDRLDNWVATLAVWNQHTYHVTNVLVDGSIPLTEDPNWSTPAAAPYNSYRRNTQGELLAQCAPDLVPSDLEVDLLLCPDLDMSARVVNQGCLGVGPGVNVAFYDAGSLIGVVQTEVAIPAGGSTTVTLQADNPGDPPFDITVSVDDDGTGMGAFNECDEDNNETEPDDFCNPVG